MAKTRRKAARIERGSGKVFADLGFPNAEEQAAKAALVSRIDDIIRQRRLTQVKAAAIMDLKQPDVSRLLNGDFCHFSVERLLRLLMTLDRDIAIVIRPKPVRARRPGRLQVVAA